MSLSKFVGLRDPMYADGSSCALSLQKRVEELYRESMTVTSSDSALFCKKSRKTCSGVADIDNVLKKGCVNPIELHWYCGPTGSGKTRKARIENPGAYSPVSYFNWKYYNGEPCVIFDNVRYSSQSALLMKAISEPGFQVYGRNGLSVLPLKVIFISLDELPCPKGRYWWLSRYIVTLFNK